MTKDSGPWGNPPNSNRKTPTLLKILLFSLLALLISSADTQTQLPSNQNQNPSKNTHIDPTLQKNTQNSPKLTQNLQIQTDSLSTPKTTLQTKNNTKNQIPSNQENNEIKKDNIVTSEFATSPQPRELMLLKTNKKKHGQRNTKKERELIDLDDVSELMADDDEKEAKPDLALIESVEQTGENTDHQTWAELRMENHPDQDLTLTSTPKTEAKLNIQNKEHDLQTSTNNNESPGDFDQNLGLVTAPKNLTPKQRKLFFKKLWRRTKRSFKKTGDFLRGKKPPKPSKRKKKPTKERIRPYSEWSEMEKKRYNRMKRFKPRKKIKKYKMGWWKPKVKLSKPKFNIGQYSPNYYPCKGMLSKKVLAHCGSSALGENFHDVSHDLSYFASKSGEKWYSKQALIFRRYKMLQSTRKRKALRTAKKVLRGEFQDAQVEALSKHYTDMHNIHAQMVSKKETIFEKSMETLKKLNWKANLMTASSMMSVVKLGITQIMLRYSKKYPPIFALKQEQIDEWKQFMLQMDYILCLEQEEKVQAWYREQEAKMKIPDQEVEIDEEKALEEKIKLEEEKQKQDEALQQLKSLGQVNFR